MKLYLPIEIERNLRKTVSEDDIAGFSRLASPLKWGRPSYSASQLLLQELGDDEERLWFWAENLANQKESYARRYASRVLSGLWGKGGKAKEMLTKLADDKCWLVREEAHSVWSELFKNCFEEVLPVLQGWSKSSSANLRRCVIIAARSAGNLREDEWAEPLLGLLEPLLSDKTEYVRKNLGPYAIGDGLLRCYPSITLKYLHRWAQAKDEGVLWNVAMAFASYGGNKNWREGVKILAQLAADERRYVWRSVASAMLYLARRQPEVKEMLKEWKKDPEKLKVAETALKYL